MNLYRYFDPLELSYLAVVSLLVCCVIMALVWLWSYKIKNAGVVDIFWSYNFPVIAVILFLFAPGFETRKLLLCAMVIIAGIRLGTHLAVLPRPKTAVKFCFKLPATI